MYLLRSELHHVLAEHSGILRMLLLVHRYLYSPDETLAGIVVCSIVRSGKGFEHSYQVLIGILLQFSP